MTAYPPEPHVPEPPEAPEPGTLPSKPCGYCTGRVAWLDGPKGGRVPLNPEPTPLGSYTVQGSSAGALTRGQAAGMAAAGRPVYQHHRETCPKAHEWAKGELKERRYRARR